MSDSLIMRSRADRSTDRFKCIGTRAFISFVNVVVSIAGPVVSQSGFQCQQIIFGVVSRGCLCHKRAMSKDALIKARVTPAMKRAVEHCARNRGESEAVIVREALKDYLRRQTDSEHVSKKPSGYRSPDTKQTRNCTSP